MKARWEAKTDNAMIKNLAKNRIEHIRKRQATDLESRRGRLAAILAAEDKVYEQEFMANLETPE